MATVRFNASSHAGYHLVPRRAPAEEKQPDEAPAPDETATTKPVDRWWRESSYDLAHGLEVHEEPADTVPGELLDELFPPKKHRGLGA